jgi:adenylate cyclase
MGVEIERKFLVDHTKWNALVKPAGTHYKQGYILNDDRGAARVRIADSNAYITFKGRSSGISRSEYEYSIPVNDGMELLKLFTQSAVEKIRYCIYFAGKIWEVDVFLADNQGLIVAEIELEQEDEQFDLPDWITIEVTEQEKYYNSSLSVHPFKNW